MFSHLLKSFLSKIIILVFFIGLFNKTHSQPLLKKDLFIINGKASGMNNEFIYIWYTNSDNQRTKDSAKIFNGAFKFEGSISEATPATITKKSLPDWRNTEVDISSVLFIEPAIMTMNIRTNDFKKLELIGSRMHAEYMRLEQLKAPIYRALKPYNNQYDSLHKEYIKLKEQASDKDVLEVSLNKMDTVRALIIPFAEKIKRIDFNFFRKYPNSFVTAYQLRSYVSDMSYLNLKRYYDKMSLTVRSSRFGVYIGKELQTLRNGTIGSKAYVFEAQDVDGNLLNLNGYLGKYVLLDFWASWCRPCREANPHLKELYQKYKNKGIEFIGVSDDDRAIDNWKAAIKKDGIGIWKHVLRGTRIKDGQTDFTNDISEKYGVYSLPTKILIDPNGIIIGRYGDAGEGHEALDKKLLEIFK